MTRSKKFIRVSYSSIDEARNALSSAESKFPGSVSIRSRNFNRIINNTVLFEKTGDAIKDQLILSFLLDQNGAFPVECHVKI